MTPIEYTTNTCIVVMDINLEGDSVYVGVLVDGVQAVLEIEPDKIMPAPSIGSKYRSEFIEGVVGIDDKFIMILDMDAIFSIDDLESLITSKEASENKVIEEIN